MTTSLFFLKHSSCLLASLGRKLQYPTKKDSYCQYKDIHRISDENITKKRWNVWMYLENLTTAIQRNVKEQVGELFFRAQFLRLRLRNG